MICIIISLEARLLGPGWTVGASNIQKNQCFQEETSTGVCFHVCHAGLSSRDARPAGKPPNVSVNWSCGDGGWEEISTSTGRRKDSGTPSRLCRRSLFARWLRLQQQVRQSQSWTSEILHSFKRGDTPDGQTSSALMKNQGLITWIYKPAFFLVTSRGRHLWFLFYRGLWENYPLHTWLVYSVNMFMMGLWY